MKRSAVAMMLVGGALLLGCSSSSSPAPAPADDSPSAQASDLGNGRYYGMLEAVTTMPDTVTFKRQEYFSGRAADKAAIEDGVISPGESVDDDVYVRDIDEPAVVLTVVDSPEIGVLKMDGGSPETKPTTFEEFATAFNAPDDPQYLREHGYWLTLQNGMVTQIEEQFHP